MVSLLSYQAAALVELQQHCSARSDLVTGDIAESQSGDSNLSIGSFAFMKLLLQTHLLCPSKSFAGQLLPRPLPSAVAFRPNSYMAFLAGC